MTRDDLSRRLWMERDMEAQGFGLRGTLQKWRQKGSGPPFILLNRSVRYVPEAVEKWLSERPEHRSTREYLTPQTDSRGKPRNKKSSESEKETATAG
jgi:hypothetical protein